MLIRKFAWLLLFVWALVCSACSVDIVAETSSPAGQDSPVTVVTSTSVPVVSDTVTTFIQETVADSSRVLGPAWADQQRWLNPQSEAVFEIYRDFILNNPNDIATPMGALCWTQHETERAIARYVTRDRVDSGIIPLYYDSLGLTYEQTGSSEQSIDVLRELLGDDNSDISEYDITVSGEVLERIKDGWKTMVEPLDDIGGEGTEWRAMFHEVIKPEVAAATRAGSGLSAPLQEFADALFAAVGEFLDGTRTDLSDPNGLSYKLVNWDQFVEEAKYSQECKRAWLFVEET